MKRLYFDARELEHPKPMEEALKLIQGMDEQSYLYMIHRKHPVPLLELVAIRGFQTLVYEDEEKDWHILITKSQNISLVEFLDV